nr:hypothetical protein [Acinetobacter sp. Marseille-Q1620]
MVLNHFIFQEIIVFTLFLCIIVFKNNTVASPLLNTDDAGITPLNSCQIESSIRFIKHTEPEYVITPACGVYDHLEFSVGYISTVEQDIRYSTLNLQLKQVLKPVEMNDWGSATSLAIERKANDPHRFAWVLNVPYTRSLYDDRLFLNSNLAYRSDQNQHNVLFSASGSYFLHPKTLLSLELFNQDQHERYFQTVLTQELIHDVLRLETSFARSISGFRGQWFGLGLSYSPNIF